MVAVAHTILVIAYHLLLRDHPFEELGDTYFISSPYLLPLPDDFQLMDEVRKPGLLQIVVAGASPSSVCFPPHE